MSSVKQSKKLSAKAVEAKSVEAAAASPAPVPAPVSVPSSVPEIASKADVVMADEAEAKDASKEEKKELTVQDLLAESDALQKLLRANVEVWSKGLKKLDSNIRTFAKQGLKRRRSEVDDGRKVKRARTSGQPSGIMKPRPITGELASFLKADPNTELALTDVSKLVCKYIKSNNLQNPARKKEIECDPPLLTLLKPDGLPVTFPLLQRYLSRHLIRPAPVAK